MQDETERREPPPIEDRDELLARLDPALQPGRFVFLRLPEAAPPPPDALAVFREPEGPSAILELERAEELGLLPAGSADACFRWIVLRVHSSLTAVGLTAAVAARLAEEDIPANVVAALRHDHLFVPEPLAARALEALRRLQHESPAAKE
ncbi:MAG: ACT domain-containing protein [Acidobacteria bacterium]|nr:MAG: ACT domain-containing protein [Acidobacteriota bacterium]REK04417.1 MAG: ACT domain-containing protein [Acidobacteriota bacterium]